ncbi:MAG: GAF domain-containing protein, partial [Candidatus Rokubacteria bacterium]|nr:GAF domain-containing protein [Candidatus Rokubacteria bacterium]
MTSHRLALGQQLRMRLRPLALAAGILISLGLPITYYALQYDALGQNAQRIAADFAAEFPYRDFDMVLAEFLPGRSIATIRVLDSKGQAVPGYSYPLAPTRAWWEVHSPVGRATTISLRGEPWTVEVFVPPARLIGVTAALLVVSVGVGVGLATLIYLFPVRVVERVEQSVDEMIARQESLVETSRLLASTLDLREVLDRLTEIARALPGIDVVRTWLVDDERGDLVLHSQAGVRRIDVEQQVRLAMGRGLTSTVIASGHPVVLRDTVNDPRLVNSQWFRLEGIASFLGVPLRVGDTLVGVLACMSRSPRDWSTDEIALAETFGTLAAVAIKNARVFGESETRRRVAEALGEVSRVLAQALEPEVVSQRVADAICALLHTRTSAVYRLDADTGDLVALAVSGTAPPAFPRGMVFPRGTGVIGVAVQERRAVMTPDILTDDRVTLTPEARQRIEEAGYGSVLVVPLMVKDRVIGGLGVGDRRGRAFNEEEIRLAQAFADQAALALENARLYAEATRQQHEAEELAGFARTLTETLDVTAIGDRIVASVLPVFAARSSALCLIEASGSLRAVAWGGEAARHFTANQLLPADFGIMGRAAARGIAQQTRDVNGEPGLSLPDELRRPALGAGDRSVLAVPLRAKGDLIGVLAVTDGA